MLRSLPSSYPGDAGYATWIATKKSRIAVISVGYADGYPFNVSKDVFVRINGYLCPVVGRVSMDVITVDITNAQKISIGDFALIWGTSLPIEHLAKKTGTIPYQIISNMSSFQSKYMKKGGSCQM